MWSVELFNKQREPLFSEWFLSAAEVNDFLSGTIRLFVNQGAEFCIVTDGVKKVECLARQASACVLLAPEADDDISGASPAFGIKNTLSEGKSADPHAP